MNSSPEHTVDRVNTLWKRVKAIPRYLPAWVLMDFIYLGIICIFLGSEIHLSVSQFMVFHLAGVLIGTMVMFTGLGAGMLWVPILTLMDIKPSEAVSISIFTQIAGKGIGSLTYLVSGMVDLEVARRLIPCSLLGAFFGYVAGFLISGKYEKALLYVFVLVAGYLLVKMIQSLNEPPVENRAHYEKIDMKGSYPIALVSSFFTGFLSIGNTDWLIPHMERKLKMTTSRAVATGLFIMFLTSLFFLLMTFISVCLNLRSWPHSTSILFATCSGVILGGQVGTRLIRYRWFRERQKHAFILLLAMSIIHLLW